MAIAYITGNQSKFTNASTFLSKYNITIEQKTVKADEIQSSNGVDIAIKKAHDAYEILKCPLFINDASWDIPSLGGFPGPYMRYMVEWFTVDDFLRLMNGVENREIILHDTVVFYDGTIEKVFTNDIKGTILNQPAGPDRGPFVTKLISLSGDGKSIAETSSADFSSDESLLWADFGEWLKTYQEV